MPKYYVESGNFHLVTTAVDARAAAIWAVHRSLSQSLPFLCEEPADYLQLGPMTHLGETIRVNQRGFGRAESVEFETLSVVTEWNQLLVAIDRLADRLEHGTGS